MSEDDHHVPHPVFDEEICAIAQVQFDLEKFDRTSTVRILKYLLARYEPSEGAEHE